MRLNRSWDFGTHPHTEHAVISVIIRDLMKLGTALQAHIYLFIFRKEKFNMAKKRLHEQN